MVMYQTPSFSGFQFGVGYSFNVNDTNAAQTGFKTADNTRAITTGLRYVNGPLNAALTYDQLNASNKLPGASTDATPPGSGLRSHDRRLVRWPRRRHQRRQRQLRRQRLRRRLQGHLLPGRPVRPDRRRKQPVRFVAAC
ncbi:hypothetical protein G6F24_017804 [Rhizopus arrhizus]|nr:hypothetical protein G6F24_017804 [Rhizopus arrhizus]